MKKEEFDFMGDFHDGFAKCTKNNITYKIDKNGSLFELDNDCCDKNIINHYNDFCIAINN